MLVFSLVLFFCIIVVIDEVNMSIYTRNQKLEIQSEDGIWLDYKDHHWIFFIKDSIWDKEEIQRIQKANIVLSFIQKGIVDAFLLEIYDCLEPSDIPFCIKDGDAILLASLKDKQDYAFEIVALDEKNIVKAVREISLEHHESKVLKEKLLKRLDENYDGEAFDQAYAKLIQRYEPYALEQYAIFTKRNA